MFVLTYLPVNKHYKILSLVLQINRNSATIEFLFEFPLSSDWVLIDFSPPRQRFPTVTRHAATSAPHTVRLRPVFVGVPQLPMLLP